MKVYHFSVTVSQDKEHWLRLCELAVMEAEEGLALVAVTGEAECDESLVGAAKKLEEVAASASVTCAAEGIGEVILSNEDNPISIKIVFDGMVEG